MTHFCTLVFKQNNLITIIRAVRVVVNNLNINFYNQEGDCASHSIGEELEGSVTNQNYRDRRGCRIFDLLLESDSVENFKSLVEVAEGCSDIKLHHTRNIIEGYENFKEFQRFTESIKSNYSTRENKALL